MPNSTFSPRMTEFPSNNQSKDKSTIRNCENFWRERESEFSPSRHCRSSGSINHSRNTESTVTTPIMVDVGADSSHLSYYFTTSPFLMSTEIQSSVKCEVDESCCDESGFCTRCLSTSSGGSAVQSASSTSPDEHALSSPSLAGLPSPVSAVMNYVPFAATMTATAPATVAPPISCFQHSGATMPLQMGSLLPEAAHFITLPAGGYESHVNVNQSSLCESFLSNGGNIRTAQQRHSGTIHVADDFQIVPNLHNTTAHHTPINRFHASDMVRNEIGGGAVTGLMYPVDLVMQERAKLERKRARNRAAATKCRHKKLERINSLQAEVRRIANKNGNIVAEIDVCKQEIKYLRDLICNHEIRGCSIDLGDDSVIFGGAPDFVGAHHHCSILSP